MKRFLAFLMIFCMFVGLTACGSSESTPSGDEQPGQQTGEPEYEWTLAHHLAEASQQHKGFLKFADDVYEKSGGRIKINISFGAALGSQRELIEQVNLGTIEMALGEASLLANYCKAFGLICAPFTFIDENQYIEACKIAVEFCMEVVDMAFQTLKLSDKISKVGNKMLSSDFKICKYYSFASIQSAIVNVEINLESIDDNIYKRKIKEKCDKILKSAESFV